jgi:magnesium-transporting ATPase (P-type)
VTAEAKAAAASYASMKRSNSLMNLDYADLLVIAAVNNTAAYDSTDANVVIGDASETALLRFCDSFGITEYYRANYRIVFSIPFSSATKFSAVICESDAFPGQHLVMLKGAPEIVLSKWVPRVARLGLCVVTSCLVLVVWWVMRMCVAKGVGVLFCSWVAFGVPCVTQMCVCVRG